MSHKEIRILDDIVARQIAAGEVIDRPNAVVRELIDNCIDSGATRIEITLKDAGLDLIQISDNGYGMSKENLSLCCLPHATSKITKSEDLQHIHTMGFRGEALSSIASVSRLIIISKQEEDSHAWQVEAKGTQIIAPIQSARNTGTTVKVERLFQDIPARRKFLSTPKAEISHVRNTILKKAAAFPSISFVFNDGHNTITLPQETALARSVRICGSKTTAHDFVWLELKQHILDEFENQHMSISAALGLPSIAQNSRRNMYLYVNNRHVKDLNLQQAMEYSYKNVLHGGKYPQLVVFLTLPPEILDVNIHPAKNEIKIKNIDKVRRFVIQSIEHELVAFTHATPELHEQHIIIDKVPSSSAPSVSHESHPHPHASPSPSGQSSKQPLGQSLKQSSGQSEKNPYNELFSESIVTEQPYASPSYKPPSTSATPRTYPHASTPATTPSTTSATYKQNSSFAALDAITKVRADSPPQQDLSPTTHHHKSNLSWTYLTTVFHTYLLFESLDDTSEEKKLILLDFHAAHERILYDELLAHNRPNPLLVPVSLAFDANSEHVTHMIKEYARLGIEITEKDEHYELTATPSKSPLSADKIATLISEIPIESQFHAELFARKACRSAVKAGDHVHAGDAYELLTKVLDMKTPRCPHGRPLFIFLTKHTLDKMIGRT